MGKSRIDEYKVSLDVPASEAIGESTESSESTTPRRRAPRAAVPLRPTSIKLKPGTRRKIFSEVARRKGLELPNRTIQGVIEDAVDRLVGGE